MRQRGQRPFVDLAEEPEETRPVGNPKVERIVEEIVSLSLIEVADLTELLKKKLKLDGLPGMMPGMMYANAPQQGAAAPAPEAPPVKEEQTEFDVSLDGFGASDKIKVIKEVRAILPELGLKDAKVLVSFVQCQHCICVCMRFLITALPSGHGYSCT